VEAVIAGVVGGVLQQLILYAIGRFAGRTFIERYGRYFGIKPSVLAVADRMFEKYGTPIVFFARFIPFVRQGISIPAGMTKMSLWKFNIYTGIASIPWSIIFILAGKKLGENWRDVVNNEHTPWFVGFALLGIVLVCGFLYLRNRQKRKQA
jgi:membrane protein DedA with SNARE-associated domain